MGIIRCTENCHYQKEGYCRQNCAKTERIFEGNNSKCVYFRPSSPTKKEK